MSECDELDGKRADLEAAAERHLGDRHLVREVDFLELATEHRGGKAGGIDRAPQPWPQMWYRAKVILVGMGEDQAQQFLAPGFDEGGVRHQEIDAGGGLIRECDAEIDHQPFPGKSVQVQVHADFVGPAQGQERQRRIRPIT